MATKLHKEIVRETGVMERDGKHRGKLYLLSMEPNGFLTFRIKGTRQRFSVGFYDVLNLAKIRTEIDKYDERMKVWKLKKEAGRRAIKPKVPAMISFYSPAYASALKIKVKRK
jgi:hypothetical protein